MLISADATGRKRDKYFWTGGGSTRSCVASECIISFLVFSKFLHKILPLLVDEESPSMHREEAKNVL